MKRILLLILSLVYLVQANEFFYEHNKKINLKRDRTIASTKKVKYFRNDKDEVIVIKDQIMVRLKAFAAITAIIQEFDLEIVRKYNNTQYILEVKDIDDVIWIANELNSRTTVTYAHPIYFNKTRYKQETSQEANEQRKSAKSGKPSSGSAKELSNAFKSR